MTQNYIILLTGCGAAAFGAFCSILMFVLLHIVVGYSSGSQLIADILKVVGTFAGGGCVIFGVLGALKVLGGLDSPMISQVAVMTYLLGFGVGGVFSYAFHFRKRFDRIFSKILEIQDFRVVVLVHAGLSFETIANLENTTVTEIQASLRRGLEYFR